MADQPSLLQQAFTEAVRPSARGRLDVPAPPVDLLAEHGCLHAAVVVLGTRRVWFPCRSHEGGVHNFAARWPKCEGPWCRSEPGHSGLHDIPSGAVEYHDRIGVTSRD